MKPEGGSVLPARPLLISRIPSPQSTTYSALSQGSPGFRLSSMQTAPEQNAGSIQLSLEIPETDSAFTKACGVEIEVTLEMSQ